MFVFDARGAENFGSGYRHPEREPDISQNLVIVTGCPSVSFGDKPIEKSIQFFKKFFFIKRNSPGRSLQVFLQKPTFHWDNIQNCIKERHVELLNMEKIVQIKSAKDASTYAMYNVDPRMTLVTAFESAKQKDKETPIANFMSELCAQLRCNKVYEGLKLSK